MLTQNIHKVFTEIFDVYHDADYYLRFFDADKNIDISLIFKDHEFRLTLFYHVVWHHTLKTYPTKKDTNNFIAKIPPDFMTDYNDDFLQILLNNVLALKNNKVDEDLKRKCKDLEKNLDNPVFITELIQDKLCYRYKNNTITDKTNLILRAIDIISSGDDSDGDLNIPFDINVITNNRVFNIVWSKQDEMWMTPFEKRQYVIYKDLHFVLKLLNYPSIYLPVLTTVPILFPLMNATENNLIVFSHTPINTAFNYIVPNQRYYECIPSISPMFFYVSHNIYPDVKSLSSTVSIYHIRTPFVTNTLDLDIIRDYDKYIKNTIEILPELVPLRIYTILDPCVQKPDTHDNKWKVYNAPPETHFKNLELSNSNTMADITIDPDDVLDCIRHGSIPILYKHSPYIRTMMNGIIVVDKEDLNKTLQNLDDNIEIIKILKKGISCFQRYLLSNEMYQSMWNYHVKHICPFRTLKTQHGILIYLDFIYSYFIKQLDSIMNLNAVKTTASNTVILVDNRPNILSVLSILFTLANLNDTWTCNIVTSVKAREYYENMLGDLVTVQTTPEFSNCFKFDIDLYNEILKSADFWDKFKDYEKCLIVQDDGVLLRKGIENFLHFDYVGAPWIDVNENEYIKNNINRELVGNGGFSLRTISLMKKICEKYKTEKNWLFFHNLNNIPEDVYFVKCVISEDGKIPVFKQAIGFASEEVIFDTCLGFHKVWAYHHPMHVEQFFKRF